jgi:hypothetical protein
MRTLQRNTVTITLLLILGLSGCQRRAAETAPEAPPAAVTSAVPVNPPDFVPKMGSTAALAQAMDIEPLAERAAKQCAERDRLAAISTQRVANGSSGLAGALAETSRWLAVRHDLRIRTDPDQVEAAWDKTVQACRRHGCELLSSAVRHADGGIPASGSLDARLPPGQLDAFLGELSQLGVTLGHTSMAEDQTDAVIDTDARHKNLSDFRDRLRSLVATPGAKLSELVELQRQLAEVQSEIDGLSGRRKALANETEKVHVVVAIEATPSLGESGLWAPLLDSARSAAQTLAQSVATLVNFAAMVLPWLLVAGLFGIVIRRSFALANAAQHSGVTRLPDDSAD